MIELRNDHLIFSFPEVHPEAILRIDFQRTLRIPDDERDYPLPPGLGSFPLRHADDFAERLPGRWLQRGGVMLPMYQSEAMWLNFTSPGDYPFAIKVAAGKVNAVTGGPWCDSLQRRPQDYLVIPDQPWLDGFCVEKGVIRQFVAMPLGSGYSAEEQLTEAAEYGGVQIIAFPIKKECYRPGATAGPMPYAAPPEATACYDMGLAPGGRMLQQIHRDRRRFESWRHDQSSRCFVHIANSLVWSAIAGEAPPTTPPTAAEYTRAGLPWFETYAPANEILPGSPALESLKSVLEMGKEKGDVPLPENESVTPERIIELREKLGKDQVREWGA
jgi:hypothetical protein